MPQSDAESLSSRGRVPWTNDALPSPSLSLSRDHITDALQRSLDDGATLDLAHKNLTDVGEDGAEELANVGQGHSTEGQNRVTRCDIRLLPFGPNSSK